MKITKRQLVAIIKEELDEKMRLLHDSDDAEAEEMHDDYSDDDADEMEDGDLGPPESMPAYAHRGESVEPDPEHHELEVRMAKSELYKLAMNAQALCDMMDDVQELPAWVQSKIATAGDRLDAVYHYMAYDKNRG